jgi:hypothetical protein
MKTMKTFLFLEVVLVARNTRIVLRNDSSVNWKANDNTILLKGELGLEFLEDGVVKIKIGDGETEWAELKYFNDTSEILSRLVKIEEKIKNNNEADVEEVLILNCGGAAGF